jgi:hypothetical protein
MYLRHVVVFFKAISDNFEDLITTLGSLDFLTPNMSLILIHLQAFAGQSVRAAAPVKARQVNCLITT